MKDLKVQDYNNDNGDSDTDIDYIFHENKNLKNNVKVDL